MKILSIETSCDETALALIEVQTPKDSPTKPQFTVHATSLFSQIEIHKEYGGVFPALAKRAHSENIIPLMSNLLTDYFTKPEQVDIEKKSPEISLEQEGQINKILERDPDLAKALIEFAENNPKPDIDHIVVTSGPGLEPALWVGITVAQAFGVAWNVPVTPVNHMEGHLTSVLLQESGENDVQFPALALLLSGGHTEMVLIKSWGQYEIIGVTLDDAIGEAYDKVARMLGLEYPGGPKISQRAAKVREEMKESGQTEDLYHLPRPMLHSKDLNFSLSGLKTAVLYTIQGLQKDHAETLPEEVIDRISYEFEEAVVEVLIKKSEKAIDQYDAQSTLVGGGVIANTYIREKLSTLAEENGIPIYLPSKDLSTDNAVMIALAGYFAVTRSKGVAPTEIVANGNWKVDRV